MKELNKIEMIDYIYDSDMVSGRFYGDSLEINLNDIIATLYNLQAGELKAYEENTQFGQILLDVCDLYEYKKDTIYKQSEECVKYIYLIIKTFKIEDED